MAEYASTLEEELEARGLTGSYTWKPNLFFAKKEDRYISADVVSDGAAAEVAEVVAERGEMRLSEIEALAAAQKALIAANEKDYRAVKASLLQTYNRMLNYFKYHNITDLESVMQTVIEQLGGDTSDV